MITDFITRILTSKPSKILLGLFLLCAAATQIVPQMIDTKPYVAQLSTNIREVSGATLLVKGGSTLQVIPYPALLLKNIEITQTGVAQAPSVTAEMVEIGVDILSIFSAQPRANHVRMAGLGATIEQQENSDAIWGFLGLPLLKNIAAIKPDKPIALEILSGRISLANAKTGESKSISHITAKGNWAEQSTLSGSCQMEETPLQFSFERNGVIGATPISLTLKSNAGDSVSLKGNMDFTADYPVITAKLDASFPNIVDIILPSQETALSQLDMVNAPRVETVEEKLALPLLLSADYAQKEDAFSLSNITIDGLNSKATGSVEWSLKDAKDHKLTLAFSKLDAAPLRTLFSRYLQQVTKNKEDKQDAKPKTLVAKNINLTLNITAAEIMHGEQQWSDGTFNGVIADGNLTVNQCTLNLPGESKVTLFGQISTSDTQGLRFEGNVEAEGKSLRSALTVFDESATNLPEPGFGAYSLRSILFISSELLRLSEADAKFSELSLKGGLVSYFDTSKPRIEAELTLHDIDFDYFRNNWRKSTSPESNDLFLRFDRGMNFDWLKKLAATIDLKIATQGFTFLEKSGKSASLRLFAQSGEIGVYNAKFDYGNETAEANVKLDVTHDEPNLNLVLNARALDTNYFMRVPAAPIVARPIKTVTPTITLEKQPTETLPEMVMPEITPEDELRAKIAEEANELHPQDTAPVELTPPAPPAPDTQKIAPPNTPQAIPETMPEAILQEKNEDTANIAIDTIITTEPQAGEIAAEDSFPETPVDFNFMEGMGGNFDISVGKLIHRGIALENFKMLAKLERNLLTFQTLRFGYLDGNFSINGTMFGGKVPGMSLGFIIASADLNQLTEQLLHTNAMGGRVSFSGTVDTSGINLHSWAEQATAKITLAARGVTIRGFDVASVVNSFKASRTAADVFNNVNRTLSEGVGEYNADGVINMQKSVFSTPGIALQTERVVGNITGNFDLLPWDINLTGLFKFPELSAENVPTMTVKISGKPDNLSLQTDTQSLEALVSKSIIGN